MHLNLQTPARMVPFCSSVPRITELHGLTQATDCCLTQFFTGMRLFLATTQFGNARHRVSVPTTSILVHADYRYHETTKNVATYQHLLATLQLALQALPELL